MKRYMALLTTSGYITNPTADPVPVYLASEVDALRSEARERVARIIYEVGDEYYLTNHSSHEIADRILEVIFENQKDDGWLLKDGHRAGHA
jgi:hypothetical protein